MKAKTDNTDTTTPKTTPITTLTPPGFHVTPEMAATLSKYTPLAWDGVNFGTKAAITSGAIVSVQSPIKTILAKATKSGNLTEAFRLPGNPSVQAVVKSLYAGTFSGLKGSLMRTTYVTNVKGSSVKTEEHNLEQANKPAEQFPFLFWSAVGESLVTGRSNSISHLQKMGVLVPGPTGNMDMTRFKFSLDSVQNNAKLVTTGFGSKTSKSLINFYALCVVEDMIAKKITVGPEGSKHLVSGVVSGVAATMINFPFDYYSDTVLGKMTANNGKLQSPYSYQVLSQSAKSTLADPRAMCKYFTSQYAKQVPVRAGLTGAIFGIISLSNQVLGDKPADDLVSYSKSKRLTFFGTKDTASEKPSTKLEPVTAQTEVVSKEKAADKPTVKQESVTTKPVTTTTGLTTPESTIKTPVKPVETTAETTSETTSHAHSGMGVRRI